MSEATPNINIDKIVMRSAINGVINQLKTRERPLRIVIHGPRKYGKTFALRAIEQSVRSSSLLYRTIWSDGPFSGTFEDANDLLILFDNIDECPDRISELSSCPQASVIASAKGRYRPARGTWDGWELVPLGPFNRAELEDLTRRFDSIPTDNLPEIIDRVIYSSNGHPFFASIELESIQASNEERDRILIDKTYQYLINLTIAEKKTLSLIAIASGYIVAPYNLESSAFIPCQFSGVAWTLPVVIQ